MESAIHLGKNKKSQDNGINKNNYIQQIPVCRFHANFFKLLFIKQEVKFIRALNILLFPAK